MGVLCFQVQGAVLTGHSVIFWQNQNNFLQFPRMGGLYSNVYLPQPEFER